MEKFKFKEIIEAGRFDDRPESVRKSLDMMADVEKYKIDKMIEQGLITEQSQELVSKNKMIDYVFELTKDARFWYVFIFITVMFNSYNYWKYQTLVFGAIK